MTFCLLEVSFYLGFEKIGEGMSVVINWSG